MSASYILQRPISPESTLKHSLYSHNTPFNSSLCSSVIFMSFTFNFSNNPSFVHTLTFLLFTNPSLQLLDSSILLLLKRFAFSPLLILLPASCFLPFVSHSSTLCTPCIASPTSTGVKTPSTCPLNKVTCSSFGFSTSTFISFPSLYNILFAINISDSITKF